jgi:hypothetical protein
MRCELWLQQTAGETMVEKLCVFCQHWDWDGGSQGYSEMTPGTDASMDCRKGHYKPLHKYSWRLDLLDLHGPDEFRAVILKAETCPDYMPVATVDRRMNDK